MGGWGGGIADEDWSRPLLQWFWTESCERFSLLKPGICQNVACILYLLQGILLSTLFCFIFFQVFFKQRIENRVICDRQRASQTLGLKRQPVNSCLGRTCGAKYLRARRRLCTVTSVEQRINSVEMLYPFLIVFIMSFLRHFTRSDRSPVYLARKQCFNSTLKVKLGDTTGGYLCQVRIDQLMQE